MRVRPRVPIRALVLVLSVVVAATGCGGEPAEDSAVDESRSTSELLLSADALPEGWGDSNSQGVDYRVTVCGVDIEPAPPVRATSIRFSKGPVGPFLEQHVRVYHDADLASGVARDLAEAIPGCTEYEAEGTSPESPTARFEVEPLTVEGAPEDSVAWRQRSLGDLPVTSDVLLVPRGDAAVLLMSYAIKADPDPEVLERAAAALPEAT